MLIVDLLHSCSTSFNNCFVESQSYQNQVVISFLLCSHSVLGYASFNVDMCVNVCVYACASVRVQVYICMFMCVCVCIFKY